MAYGLVSGKTTQDVEEDVRTIVWVVRILIILSILGCCGCCFYLGRRNRVRDGEGQQPFLNPMVPGTYDPNNPSANLPPSGQFANYNYQAAYPNNMAGGSSSTMMPGVSGSSSTVMGGGSGYPSAAMNPYYAPTNVATV